MSEEKRTIFDHLDQLHQFLSPLPTPAVRYNKNALNQVTVAVDANKYSSYVLLSIIRDLQDEGWSESSIDDIAACAFNVHFDVEDIRSHLHKFIQTSCGCFRLHSYPVFSSDAKLPIKEFLQSFKLSIDESMEGQEITTQQLETTCSAAYFILIKIAKHKNRETSVNEYARRLVAQSDLVNQSLFTWLVNEITSFGDFDQWMKPGGLVASSMTCAGVILLSQFRSFDSQYFNVVSTVLQGMTMDSFATYQLMSEVVDADNIDLYQLAQACNTPQWKRMMNLVKERREDLNASPCWYMISPIILPNTKCDFELSANPVVTLTCIKILKLIRPDAESCFADLTIPCYQVETEEAELASKQYMARRQLKVVDTFDASTISNVVRSQDVVCEDCEKLVIDLAEKLRSQKFKNDLINMMNQDICTLLPDTIQESCKEYAREFLPMVIDLLSQQIQQKVSMNYFTEKSQDIVCEDCEKLVIDLAEKLRSQKFKNDLINMMNQDICTLLPDTIQESCKEYAREFLPMVIDLLSQQIQQKVSMNYFTEKSQDIVCEDCEKLVIDLAEKLRSQKFKNDLINMMNQDICTLLPDTIQESCKEYARDFLPMVIDLLSQQIISSDGYIVRKCHHDKYSWFNRPVSNPAFWTSFDSTNELKNGETATDLRNMYVPFGCRFCEVLFGELLNLIPKDRTEEVVKKALDEVCDIMPLSIQNDCTKFVDTYGPQIIEALLAGTAPKLFCTIIQLCGDQPSSISIKPLAHLLDQFQGPTTCTVCKGIVFLIDQMLEANATKEQLIDSAKKACGYLPSQGWIDECDTLIDTYAEQIFEYLDRKETPEKICELIGQCSEPSYLASPNLLASRNLFCQSVSPSLLCKVKRELTGLCGVTYKCLFYQAYQQFYASQSATESGSECWVRSRIADSLQLQRQLFGRRYDNRPSDLCSIFAHAEDREICNNLLKYGDSVGRLHNPCKADDLATRCQSISIACNCGYTTVLECAKAKFLPFSVKCPALRLQPAMPLV